MLQLIINNHIVDIAGDGANYQAIRIKAHSGDKIIIQDDKVKHSSLKLKIKKVLFIALMSLVSSNAETMQTKSEEMISSPKGTFKDDNTINQKVISVVFYRLDGNKHYVSTVKAGNNIVGSLLPNHYADTKVCKNRLLVGVAERGDLINITHYDLSTLENISNTIYLKVIEPTGNNRFGLSITDPKVAQKEISSLKLKSNIINRHVPSCDQLPFVAPTVISKQSSIITLDADALFASNSSYIKTAGIKKLNEFIKDYKDENAHIGALSIKGYTDYLGSDKYNLWLSQRRADRVSDYLKINKLNMPIYTKGLGETNPVVTGCEVKSSRELIECLQPNRRVTIEIIEK